MDITAAVTGKEYKRLKHIQSVKQWQKSNPDLVKGYAKAYYERHKDEILAKKKAKYLENKQR